MTAIDFSRMEHLLPDEVEEESWRVAALCHDEEPDLFFPVVLYHDATIHSLRTSSRYLDKARAKEICEQCPVQSECLVYSFETRQPIGIWGGLTPAERGIGTTGSEKRSAKLRSERRRVIVGLGLGKKLERWL